ncbi:MAG: hypothetical protein IPP79_20710 [Chitinophagaceae bacterium]|nr:hypothetical protein [Chitinophagaceae bacterium]
MSRDSAVGRSTLAKSNKARLTVAHLQVPLIEEQFQIVNASDLSKYADVPPYENRTAKEQLKNILEAYPDKEGELIIIPFYNSVSLTPPIINENSASL